MKRLIRQAKPRPKKKELVFTTKHHFECFSDNEDIAKDILRKFKQWISEVYPEWATTQLQHFLYAYNLSQNSEDNKYLYEFHLDKILKDESVTIDQRTWFDKGIETVEKESEEKRKKMEDELFEDK